MLTPPKVLSKKGVTEDQLQRKKPMMKSSSLEEVVADVGKGRMKKKKEKKRFEEARWERVENIQKRRWTFSKVPDEKKKLLIDLPARNNITRLAVFSLYFTDDLLLYLLERRESEMATYWSSGLSIRVNLQTIKQVCFLKAFLFTFDSYLYIQMLALTIYIIGTRKFLPHEGKKGQRFMRDAFKDAAQYFSKRMSSSSSPPLLLLLLLSLLPPPPPFLLQLLLEQPLDMERLNTCMGISTSTSTMKKRRSFWKTCFCTQ